MSQITRTETIQETVLVDDNNNDAFGETLKSITDSERLHGSHSDIWHLLIFDVEMEKGPTFRIVWQIKLTRSDGVVIEAEASAFLGTELRSTVQHLPYSTVREVRACDMSIGQ